MQITAHTNENGSAELKGKTNSSAFGLTVPDADNLADDIEATLQLGRKDLFRPSYAVLIEDNGCQVKVGNGGLSIPWQYITSVVAQLRA